MTMVVDKSITRASYENSLTCTCW